MALKPQKTMNIIYILQKIRKIRKEKGISQKEMSEKLGLAQANYNQFELGSHTSISIDRLDKIAGIFEMQLFDLLNEAEQTKQETKTFSFDDAHALKEKIKELEQENNGLKNFVKSIKYLAGEIIKE